MSNVWLVRLARRKVRQEAVLLSYSGLVRLFAQLGRLDVRHRVR